MSEAETAYTGYELLDIAVSEQVATITMGRLRPAPASNGETVKRVHRAEEIARALGALRADNNVRVVVLTGRDEVFTYPPSSAPWHGNPGTDYDGITGLARALETIVAMEKPVVAKVNGPAVGFGSSLVFASDFVVAREDAVIADHHLGMGEVEVNGEIRGLRDRGVVPGDGGTIFVPLAMPPAMAKEYLMLAKPRRADELARMGIINYAVPAAELDSATDDLVARLLRRNAYALAWTKRVVNQRARLACDIGFDAAAAYEFLGFYMQRPEAAERAGERGRSRL